MPGRVLITGAQGFLGRSLTAALLATDCPAILGVGRSARSDDVLTHTLDWAGRPVPAPVPEGLRPTDDRYDYRPLDVRDPAAVARVVADFRPDVAIHAAASLRGEGLDSLLEANVRSAYGLLTGYAKRVVLVSSGSVYGAGGGVVPLREDGITEPVELYGVTKLTAEHLGRVLSADLVVGRVFNLVGPGLHDRHLPAYLAGRLAAVRRGLAPPEIPLAPVETTRDFIDVGDAARALVLLADAPAGVYNVASGVETPVQSVVDQLLAVADVEVTFTPKPARPADIRRAYADVSRLAALGFRPTSPLQDTLANMLGYFSGWPAG
jgi:GDP-4-dehydro-6-deoxy-D-mannose reductase